MDQVRLTTLAWQTLRLRPECGVFVHRVADHPQVEEHDHLFHEIVCIEAGTAEHLAADGQRTLRPGDVILIRPQVWHAYRAPRGLRLVNCLIDSPLMTRLGHLLDRVDGAADLFRRRTPTPRQTPPLVLQASPAERPGIIHRLNAMLEEQQHRRNGWQAALAAGVLDLVIAVSRLNRGAAPPAGPVSGRTEQAVYDTASYLERHFQEPVRLDRLAARVHVSAGHLCRSFSRCMGMGIVQFVHHIRAEEACRLLRFTNEPVTAIAGKVGYDEIAYFSRCFRAQIGRSPRQYRQARHEH
jgi:AraC family transcriptional regulator, L-rhamnose operon transcriptional activator RhaR